MSSSFPLLECSLFSPIFTHPKCLNSTTLFIPREDLPPPLVVNNGLFQQLFVEDGQKVRGLSGILVNTMDALEGDMLAELNGDKVLHGFPPVIPVGPLLPCDQFENQESAGADSIKWLDGLPPTSVVFLAFLAIELQPHVTKSGTLLLGCFQLGLYRFLWVVKDKVVDKEDEEGLEEVVGKELMEKIKEKGIVVKDWVNQAQELGHPAMGGFVSHCGWNSVMEALLHGVPMLVWPQGGDQMVSAEPLARKGLGIWVRAWGCGSQVLVKGEEIGERIKELMENEDVRTQTAKIKEEAIKVVEDGGNCDAQIQQLIKEWKL